MKEIYIKKKEVHLESAFYLQQLERVMVTVASTTFGFLLEIRFRAVFLRDACRAFGTGARGGVRGSCRNTSRFSGRSRGQRVLCGHHKVAAPFFVAIAACLGRPEIRHLHLSSWFVKSKRGRFLHRIFHNSGCRLIEGFLRTRFFARLRPR